ncbi:MAG: response regulator [Chloroflexus sp.]
MIFTSGSMFGVQWWITNRYVTRPLMKLTAAARQVAAGWRATPIPIAGTDEIGDLARALAQLTADLNDTIATLEERVAQRTAQLEQALTENEALLTRERRRRHSEQVLINLSLALINLCNEEIIYRHLVEILASGNESDNWIGVYTRDTNGFWNLRATGGYQYSHLLQLTAPLALLTRPTNLFYIADLSQQQIDQLPNVQGSVIVATIYLHDQPHALLVIYRPQANAFTEDEIANVNIATRLVSQAITRGQLMVSLQQAKEHAEAVNRARMTFLARLDQAVRQRLNTIVAISETLREVLTDRPVAAEDTDKIARAGRQLLIQLNTLLDNAKIEAGMLTLRPEPFALDTLLDSVLQDIKPLISQNYNQLEIDRPPNLGLIIADMNRLRQVLLYPLRFAASTTRRGVVTVVVRRIPATDQQTFLELIISDTGPTLSNAQVQALLTPFALPPTEPRVADEGSGLALSRQLCELMGGTLTAHSGQFIGLTFTIRLPITFSTEQRAITEPSATLPHPDLVLITATEPHALRSALEQEGWYVHQAATLQEAITALRQPPAAILIDLPSDRAPIEALLRASNWQRTSIVWLVPPDTDQEEPGLMRAVWPGDTKTLIEKLHTVIVHTQPSSKPILVIEDEAPTRLIIRRFLEHEGWNVIEASNVAVGAMLWRSFQPRLVILDLMLPDGDGFELLRELWPESPVPVVVVTAKLLQTAELIILANVGAVVLHKGRFRRNELLEAVHKLMKETTLMQAKMRQ